MATLNWANIDLSNGMLPGGIKPLAEPMLIYHQRGSVGLIYDQFCSKIAIHKMSLKNTIGNLLLHPMGWYHIVFFIWDLFKDMISNAD